MLKRKALKMFFVVVINRLILMIIVCGHIIMVEHDLSQWWVDPRSHFNL